MAVIKIHDLPEIRFDSIKDTDISIIENEIDTYKIPIADLKKIYSNDNKLQAIYNSLSKRIDDIISNNTQNQADINSRLEEQSKKIDSLVATVQDLNSSMVEVKNNIATLTTNLTDLTKKVTINITSIEDINKLLDKHQQAIDGFTAYQTEHIKKYNQLATKVGDNATSIDQLRTKCSELEKLINDYNGVSTDSLNQVKSDLQKEIIDKYNELLGMIDVYKHETPLIT